MIKQEWELYMKSLYPSGLHVIQEKETMQAFYAGAFCSLNILIEAMESGQKLEEKFDLLYRQIADVLKSKDYPGDEWERLKNR
jgi:hypothetical protein